MKSRSLKTGNIIIAIAICLSLPGCGGSKILKNPESPQINGPLATISDQNLEVILDFVIVRGGPGTWAKNADWDEYLLRVRNLSDSEIHITGISVLDSLGTQHETNAERSALVKGTKAVSKRYKDEGIEVKAGMGGAALMAVGGTAYVAGAGLGAAALAGGGSAVAGAAVVGILAAPVLAVGGVFRVVNNSRVGDEILNRQSVFPVVVAANGERNLDVFFSLAPSPALIELRYSGSKGAQKLVLDTQKPLKNLHIDAR